MFNGRTSVRTLRTAPTNSGVFADLVSILMKAENVGLKLAIAWRSVQRYRLTLKSLLHRADARMYPENRPKRVMRAFLQS
jgi:hypothetical protein